MASFFGEVIQPNSRAFWNDDEDDYGAGATVSQEIKFNTNWIETEPAGFEKFIIIDGETINDFASRCLLQDAKVICKISNQSDTKSCATIYACDADIFVCAISSKFDLTLAGLFVELISPLLAKSKLIYAITSYTMSQFKSTDEIDTPSFLKCLYTKTAKQNVQPGVSLLNQPNIATGVCAGALTYAKLLGSRCVMYILYTDTYALDSRSASPLVGLFAGILGRAVPGYRSDATAVCVDRGNLYL